MSSLCSPESFNYLKIQPWCPSAPNKWRNGPNGSLPDDTVHFLISLSRLLFLSPLHQLQLLFFHVIFSCNRSPATPSPCQGGGFALRAGWPGLLWVRSEAGIAQEGGRPSTGTQHITRYFIVPFKKKSRLTVCGLTNWCCAYGDEVVFGEAAGRDVVLQELLGKVLVHPSCLVGVHAVPTGLVQIWWEKIIVAIGIHLRVILCWFSHIVIFAKPWPLLIQLWLHYSVMFMYWCHNWKRTRCLCLLCKGIAPCITISCFTLLEA